jgi:hypothetical protein
MCEISLISPPVRDDASVIQGCEAKALLPKCLRAPSRSS